MTPFFVFRIFMIKSINVKKFFITEHERKNILGMYGLLKEQSSNLIVTSGYTVPNDIPENAKCDALHAFQGIKDRKVDSLGNESTYSRPIGNVHDIVLKQIKEWNKQGIKVKATKVDVSVNGMAVKWTVTFEKSDKNWIGFTSRGAGCNDNIEFRAGNDTYGNGPQDIRSKVGSAYGPIGEIEIVNAYTYKDPQKRNSFKQIFYRYTLKDDPMNVKTTNTNQTQSPQNNANTNQTQSTQNNDKKPVTIKGSDLGDLRNRLSASTQNISIDLNSIKVDMNSFSVSYNYGNTQIQKLSLLFDPDKDNLDNNRLPNILSQNPTMKVIQQGETRGFAWALSIILP